MTPLSLVRSASNRSVYELAGVGSLWVAGWLGGERAFFTTNNGTWTCSKAGVIGGPLVATGPSGSVDGRFAPGFLGTTGSMSWARTQYALGPAGGFSTNYRLDEGGRTLCEFGVERFFGERWPIDVIGRRANLPDEALMFAIYAVRTLARQKARKKSRRRSSMGPLGSMFGGS
ncbi:MAG: hypothetical protein Q7T55_08625 [Solirubrobacteraceae bacterium]|nr:hypothetical protein [Solirubrobacteraceae bacterium]